MKNLRQIFLTAVSLLILCSALISCGAGRQTDGSGDGTEVTTTDNPAEAITTTARPDVTPVTESYWVSAIFGGGPFVTGGETVREDIKASGFNTLMIWSVHVAENGDLSLNDRLVCRDGSFIINKRDADRITWRGIRGEDSSITRIELSVGAWGTGDFEHIRTLMNRDGDGEDTILYRNLKALIEETGADAVNFDDESCYDAAALTNFGKMCVKMGCKVTLCPYTNMNVWLQVKNNLGDDCDRVYLQCYEGGTWNRNSIKTWYDAFGMDIIPGYWCLHSGSGDTPDAVKTELTNNSKYVRGAFMWLYDDMQKLTGKNATAYYGKAINDANPES